MSIFNVGQVANSLQNYDTKNWSRTVELNSRKTFENEFPTLSERESTQSFGDFLSESISKVNSLQSDANVAMQKLASGESKNIHETLLAVERADIAFKQMNQIRLKVIDAYKEIMKMQV